MADETVEPTTAEVELTDADRALIDALDGAVAGEMEELDEDEAPSDDDAPLDPDDEETTPEKPSGGSDSGSESKQDPRYIDARAALLRSGMLEAEVDALQYDDVLARGQKRAEVLATADSTYQRLKELQAKLEGTEASTDDGETVEQPSAPVSKLDPAALLESLGLDETSGGPLVEIVTGLDARLARVEQAEATLRRLEKTVGESVKQSESQAFSAARARVGERFPDVGDDGRSDELLSRMRVLAKDESFRSHSTVEARMDALMSAAARSLGWSEASSDPAPEPAPATNGSDPKKRGTPPTSTRRTKQKGLSPERRARIAWDMAEEGKSEDEIRKVLGRT